MPTGPLLTRDIFTPGTLVESTLADGAYVLVRPSGLRETFLETSYGFWRQVA